MQCVISLIQLSYLSMFLCLGHGAFFIGVMCLMPIYAFSWLLVCFVFHSWTHLSIGVWWFVS